MVVVTSAVQSRRAASVFRETLGADVAWVVIGADQAGCPPCFPVDLDQYRVALCEYQNLLGLWPGLAH